VVSRGNSSRSRRRGAHRGGAADAEIRGSCEFPRLDRTLDGKRSQRVDHATVETTDFAPAVEILVGVRGDPRRVGNVLSFRQILLGFQDPVFHVRDRLPVPSVDRLLAAALEGDQGPSGKAAGQVGVRSVVEAVRMHLGGAGPGATASSRPRTVGWKIHFAGAAVDAPSTTPEAGVRFTPLVCRHHLPYDQGTHSRRRNEA
jgi:hypothetical protein